MRCYLVLGVGGASECSGRPILIFLLKQIEFASWPDIMLIIHYNKLLEINLPFEFDVRQ